MFLKMPNSGRRPPALTNTTSMRPATIIAKEEAYCLHGYSQQHESRRQVCRWAMAARVVDALG
jgi:hypothetical protein